MSIAKTPPIHNIKAVIAEAWQDGQKRTLHITAPQTARTLVALVIAGKNGITALQMGSWAFRLGAYIHNLRQDYRMEIETLREGHEGGWHARYVLHTPCEIVDIITD